MATLLGAGSHRERDCSFAIELASEFGHREIAELLLTIAVNENDDFSFAQAVSAGSQAVVSVCEAADLERDPSLWTQAFATSTPLLVRGCCHAWSDSVSNQKPEQLRERWGEHQVAVAFSPDGKMQFCTLFRVEIQFHSSTGTRVSYISVWHIF